MQSVIVYIFYLLEKRCVSPKVYNALQLIKKKKKIKFIFKCFKYCLNWNFYSYSL